MPKQNKIPEKKDTFLKEILTHVEQEYLKLTYRDFFLIYQIDFIYIYLENMLLSNIILE